MKMSLLLILHFTCRLVCTNLHGETKADGTLCDNLQDLLVGLTASTYHCKLHICRDFLKGHLNFYEKVFKCTSESVCLLKCFFS
jgi:hypothetical protein